MEGDKVLGEIIRHYRKQLGLSQTDFYNRCIDIEGKKERPRKGVEFRNSRTNSADQIRAIISFEKGRVRINPEKLRIIEKAIGLPQNILDGKFESVQHFIEIKENYRGRRTSSSSTNRARSPGRSKGRGANESGRHCRDACTQTECVAALMTVTNRKDRSGIPLLPQGHRILPFRSPLLKDISENLLGKRAEKLRIALIHGQPGVGKSRIIAEWWAHEAVAHKDVNNVLSIKCGNLPGDQLIRAINRHFLGEDLEEVGANLAKAICICSPLIILDGLSSLPLGLGPRESPTDADRMALQRVRNLIRFLGENDVRARILIGVQSTDDARDVASLTQGLHAGVSMESHWIPPLSDKEGAEVLRELGVKGMRQEDLERISNALLGLPIALEAAANYLAKAEDGEREDYVTRVRHSKGESFSEMFHRYVTSLDNVRSDAHLHAFMRLLALMPGPVPKSTVDEILATGQVGRLKNGSVGDFLRQSLPFIVDLNERIDIHPYVRSLLREQLEDAAHKQAGDPTTSIDELYWIHATAAKACVRRLPKDANAFTHVDVEAIEGTIYHLLALRAFSRGRHLDGKSTCTDSLDEFIERVTNSELSPKNITHYLFEKIAGRFLFNRNHHMTRILGHFETKARILTYFFEGHHLRGNCHHLCPEDRRKLLSEIGICWMHAGRLNLAVRALGLAKQLIPVTGACAADELWDGPPTRAQDWVNRAEIVSTEALIGLRLGRNINNILDGLEAEWRVASDIATRAHSDYDEKNDTHEALMKSARRILGRRAQVIDVAGNSESASIDFSVATQLGEKLKQKHLDGEAARRFAYHKARTNKNCEDALEIIKWNITKSSRVGSNRIRQSNEIVPFLVASSFLHRIGGDLLWNFHPAESRAATEVTPSGAVWAMGPGSEPGTGFDPGPIALSLAA